jgi:hypothetical protein
MFTGIMPTENKSNKIITIVLAVIITLAAITVIYISLPQNKENEKTSDENNGQQDGNNPTEESVILTVIYGDEQTNYTLEELEALDSYTGTGGYIKTKALPTVIITGPYEYTGVSITLLLNQINNLPENYSIIIKASDDWTTEYNQSQIQGDVAVYNESGNITGTGGVTMLLAYKEDGEYINESTDGSLRIVYVDDEAITSSSQWAKMVVSIEIVEQ